MALSPSSHAHSLIPQHAPSPYYARTTLFTQSLPTSFSSALSFLYILFLLFLWSPFSQVGHLYRFVLCLVLMTSSFTLAAAIQSQFARNRSSSQLGRRRCRSRACVGIVMSERGRSCLTRTTVGWRKRRRASIEKRGGVGSTGERRAEGVEQQLSRRPSCSLYALRWLPRTLASSPSSCSLTILITICAHNKQAGWIGEQVE